MAMTVKKGDVVKVNEFDWSYSGNFSAGHIGVVTAIHEMADPLGGQQWVNIDGVVTAIHEMADPLGGQQWVNIDGESGSPYWTPVTGMSMMDDTGALFEALFEDMQHGDTLIAVERNEDDNHLKVGATYTALENDCGCCFHFEDDDGDLMYHWDDDFYFINLSALKREYQSDTSPMEVAVAGASADLIFLDEGVERIAPLNLKYDDMDNAAKGAILLAAHEGKTVQFLSRMGNFWMDDTSFDPSENLAYRVKPQELIDAEEALNAAESKVISMSEARDNAVAELDVANSSVATAEFTLASAKDTVEALNAA